MCKVLNVSRSGYYQWTRRQESERKKRRRELEQQISRIFVDSRRLYGSPKITQVLRQQGVRVSEKTVARIMKELGLKSRTVKKYKATTNSKKKKKKKSGWQTSRTFRQTRDGFMSRA